MNYYSLDRYLREKFGQKTYKLALSSGCSCPNRDGTIGTEGCIFCGEQGSGDFASDASLPVTEQIQNAKLRVKHKIPSDSYIAYFQSFTNTYGPVSRLAPLFREAIDAPGIVALSVATRPDAISEDMYDVLSSLAKQKPVWVELGLQTIHEQTANQIRRGFDLRCFETAVTHLKKIGVKVIVHLILGLPGETREMILSSVDYVARLHPDGVKLQLLHVLQNTRLAEMYAQNTFSVMTRDAYINLLGECIEHLPDDLPIHRLTGDGPKSLLIAPLWSADKRAVRNAITKSFTERNIIQGRLFTEVSSG